MAEIVCDDRPLTFEDLVAWFDVGSKPKDQWRVGAEHEKFVFRLGPMSRSPTNPALLNRGASRRFWTASPASAGSR